MEIEKVRAFETKADKYNFIVWLRAMGCVLIVLCHYVQHSSNPYVMMSAQFFNVGVNIFFIVSGFCFGIQKGRITLAKWYKKRIKRIFVPYEIVVVAVLLASVVSNMGIDVGKWLKQAIGLQGFGSINNVPALAHTWFITSILLCYLITPILERLRDELENRGGYIVFAVLPILIAYQMEYIFVDYALINPICWYAIAYLMASGINTIKITRGKAAGIFVTMCVCFVIRIVFRYIADDTMLYNFWIVTYTHAIVAFCIFFLAMYFLEKMRIPWVIQVLDKLSYEIYLWHYIFTVEPFGLFGRTSCWFTDCVFITVVTLVMSFLTNFIAGIVIKRRKGQ